MKRFYALIVLFFCFLIASCKSSVDCPKLKIVNNNSSYSVLSVSLVGYSFNNLDIQKGETKTFELFAGIPGGYNNVNVIVNYGKFQLTSIQKSKRFNFADGVTTVITLTDSGIE